MHTTYIGLGSNLNGPIDQIKQALQSLATLPATQMVKHSALYQSAPLGPAEQPDYINAVAMLVTTLSPRVLLNHLQAIEKQQGRIRNGQRWGPRTLDLDMLLYGNKQLHNSSLILPHPGLYERAFVLYPLYDCTPNLVLPNGQMLSMAIQCCSSDGIRRVG